MNQEDRPRLPSEEALDRACRPFDKTSGDGLASPPPKDNWADKSTHCCFTCMWFVPKQTFIPADMKVEPNPLGDLGRCRRHSPTLGGFPVVYESDFCGDHKLK